MKCNKFFQDPDWYLVSDMLTERISVLKDMSRVDLSQPSDTVKAEVKGRLEAFKALEDFLADVKAIRRTIENKPVSFR